MRDISGNDFSMKSTEVVSVSRIIFKARLFSPMKFSIVLLLDCRTLPLTYRSFKLTKAQHCSRSPKYNLILNFIQNKTRITLKHI